MCVCVRVCVCVCACVRVCVFVRVCVWAYMQALARALFLWQTSPICIAKSAISVAESPISVATNPRFPYGKKALFV